MAQILTPASLTYVQNVHSHSQSGATIGAEGGGDSSVAKSSSLDSLMWFFNSTVLACVSSSSSSSSDCFGGDLAAGGGPLMLEFFRLASLRRSNSMSDSVGRNSVLEFFFTTFLLVNLPRFCSPSVSGV
uniref:(northern house mosquito) hypothetical protein n=1 Tax=Culex pipiens TaxID=7175 RepID=A0A8D8ITR3_CULPI